MKEYIAKYLFPALLALLGIVLLIVAFVANQNNLFILGGIAVLLMAILSILSILEVINKLIYIISYVFLILLAILFVGLDFKSIKDPIDFQNEKERRYEQVIQRLKDIRTAQLAYKTVKGKYASDFDSLLHFINNDSFPVIKAVGTVPDTLTEAEALQLGLVKRDTSYVSVKDSIFSKRFLSERKFAFHIDSLPYVPFTNRARFDMQAGEIEKNRVIVRVFQVTDTKPFDSETVLQVGSMTEPTTNGNWGE